MQETRKNIDQLLQDNLLGQEAVVPPAAWEAIESAVAPQKKRRGFFWLFGGAGLLLAGIMLFFLMGDGTAVDGFKRGESNLSEGTASTVNSFAGQDGETTSTQTNANPEQTNNLAANDVGTMQGEGAGNAAPNDNNIAGSTSNSSGNGRTSGNNQTTSGSQTVSTVSHSTAGGDEGGPGAPVPDRSTTASATPGPFVDSTAMAGVPTDPVEPDMTASGSSPVDPLSDPGTPDNPLVAGGDSSSSDPLVDSTLAQTNNAALPLDSLAASTPSDSLPEDNLPPVELVMNKDTTPHQDSLPVDPTSPALPDTIADQDTTLPKDSPLRPIALQLTFGPEWFQVVSDDNLVEYGALSGYESQSSRSAFNLSGQYRFARFVQPFVNVGYHRTKASYTRDYFAQEEAIFSQLAAGNKLTLTDLYGQDTPDCDCYLLDEEQVEVTSTRWWIGLGNQMRLFETERSQLKLDLALSLGLSSKDEISSTFLSQTEKSGFKELRLTTGISYYYALNDRLRLVAWPRYLLLSPGTGTLKTKRALQGTVGLNWRL